MLTFRHKEFFQMLTSEKTCYQTEGKKEDRRGEGEKWKLEAGKWGLRPWVWGTRAKMSQMGAVNRIPQKKIVQPDFLTRSLLK